MEEKRYIKRKEKARSEGNREHLAVGCNSLGDFYNQQGKYNEAVKEYQQAAQLYTKLGKQLEMGKAERMVGEMFMLLCEFDSAKVHINNYLKIAKKLQNKVEEQRAYATLGRVHLLHGQSLSETSASGAMEQLKHAEKSFLRSLLLIKELSGQISKLEQLDMQARCYLNIGVVKEHMEQFEESIAYIDKAIKICKTHDLFELTHLCYISMSLLYNYKKNDSTAALRYCNLALEAAKRLPNKVKKICETLITKSEILIKVGDFASVKQILTKAYKKNTPDENDRNTIERTLRIVVKICQTLDELVTTSSVDYAKRKVLYEKLGDGCCHLINYEKAIEYYLQMLFCAQQNQDNDKSLVPIYVSLYQTYKDNKQYDKALEYLWKEFELNKDVPAEAFTTLCSIAEICELQAQPFWTVQDIYQKARVLAAKAGAQQTKLEKIVMVRLKKLQLKHGMDVMASELDEEAKSKGLTLDENEEDDSDNDCDSPALQQNTPDLGDDVCLDDLTDSDTSDLDETDKPRPHRATRGTRSLTLKRNNKGETQLHQACIAGNLELVRRLIEQGHTVNVRDHAGWLPLHEASNHGFRDIVELLLDKGASAAINDKGGTSCDGITPLYDACSNGYLDVVELLLERGADSTVKTDYGETCVSGLDKWRVSATLTEGEQAHYEQVRATLLKTLSKVGICSASKNAQPLTNDNVIPDIENSTNAGCTSDEESEEVRPSRRSGHNLSGSSGNKILRDTNKPIQRQQSMSKEYRNVMAQLKHPNRATSAYDDDCGYSGGSSSSHSNKKRNAFLQEDEVDADSWLVDDVGPERKKRRYNTPLPSNVPLTSTTTNATRLSINAKENMNDSAYSQDAWELDSNPASDSDAFQVLLDAATNSTAQQRQKQARKLSLSRTSSMSSNGGGSQKAAGSSSTSGRSSKTKMQASLLDSGFCRFRSESPIGSSEDSADASSLVSLRTTEPDSTTTAIQLVISPAKSSPIKVQATQIVSTTISFKVKVQDELLLVPVERKKLNEINIRWLAEETARRYYNLIGLKPVLRLKTPDGFAYEENDSVSVAIEQTMILATVLEWKISPLVHRYEEMCHQLNKDVNPTIKEVMKRAESSNEVDLVDFWLQPLQMEPIFKALLHQTALSVLDLSNNFVQNEGCRQLAKSLPTLQHLKTLNLNCNFITSEGLEALLCCAGIEKVEQLEELKLSQNPLGNNAVRILDKYCNSAQGKALRTLYIAQCDLTNLYEFDLAYYQLTAFDISYNQLSEESMRHLLSKLNSCRLQYINLSYTKLSSLLDERNSFAYGERLVSFFESGTCEKFKRIDLCGCGLRDAHMYSLLQCFSKANDLQLLDISDNDNLTPSSLGFIINEVPHLRKLIATNCAHLVDDVRLEKMKQHKQLPNLLTLTISEDCNELESLRSLWHARWGEKAKFYVCGRQVSFYVFDKDVYIS